MRMIEERRKSLRRRVLKAAKIIFSHNTSVVNCSVRNLSEDGALLLLPSTLGIPARFELLMENATERVTCEVVRQREKQLAVHFVDRAPSRGQSDWKPRTHKTNRSRDEDVGRRVRFRRLECRLATAFMDGVFYRK